jgi:hypothetical protein
MLGNNRSVTVEQHHHLRLRQPYRFFFQTNIRIDKKIITIFLCRTEIMRMSKKNNTFA